MHVASFNSHYGPRKEELPSIFVIRGNSGIGMLSNLAEAIMPVNLNLSGVHPCAGTCKGTFCTTALGTQSRQSPKPLT